MCSYAHLATQQEEQAIGQVIGQFEEIDVKNPQPIQIIKRIMRMCLPKLKKQKSLVTVRLRGLISGGACGGRTHDKRIKSPLLYQLS